MNDVVIVSACRTAIGSFCGQFRTITSLDLSIPVMRGLVERAGVDPAVMDDVIWGCNYQRTYKENNLARVALVKAGLPTSVPGITIHRNCTSSMSAIQMGYYQIRAQEAECIMAGGADSMSTAPHMVFGMRNGMKFGDIVLHDSMWDSLTNLGIGPAMGITAENVAERCGITREQQDEYSLLSQKRAVAAQDAGLFRDEIVPVEIKSKKGSVICDTDEYPRRDCSLDSLGKLRPSFKEGGTVTAGNSSGLNDAAAGVLLMSRQAAERLNIRPLARIVSTATVGLDPDIMGLGPVGATRRALEKAELTLDDLDLIEVNEAFAAQYLGCEKELGLHREITNVNGSGISLGHPVGASGCRLVVTLLYELQRRGGRYGLATLCAGGGMGTAVVIERL